MGFRLLWRDGKTIKPYLMAKGGFLVFTQKAESPNASYENISLQSDLGVQIRLTPRVDLRLGWGLGFAIRTDPELSWVPGSVGSFAWSGAWGTYFWIDPSAKLIAVQMVQVPRPDNQRYFDAIRHLTYAALDLSGRTPSEPEPPAHVVGESLLSTDAGRYILAPR